MSDDPAIQKILTHRSFVLKELVESEKEYVHRLRIAVEDYLLHIKAGGPDVPPGLKADILSIFSTLPEIYEFHRDVFLPKLESNHDDVVGLMQCFHQHKGNFAVYQPYCKNKPNSDCVRAEYDEYFQQRMDDLTHRLNIDDVLIAPVQRFTKYQLLIRDLLKDHKKAQLETSEIELALDLMKEIPKETNNIICLSLLRGISRAKIIGHGTLYRQDNLQIWDGKAVRGEMRQVFLFDHKIIIATAADHDGFFEYQTGIRTLNGVIGEADHPDPLKFSFTTADKEEKYCFQCPTPGSRTQWWDDLDSILNSQDSMMKALMSGVSAATKPRVRVNSEALTWSDSDSSVESVHSGPKDEEGEEGVVFTPTEEWPKNPGFHPFRRLSKIKKPKNKRDRSRSAISQPSAFPQSSTFPSLYEMENGVHSRSRTATLSSTLNPRLLTRWFTRRRGNSSRDTVKYPLPSGINIAESIRSPGAVPHDLSSERSTSPETDVLFIGKETQPPIDTKLYTVLPGQVFKAVDVSQGDVWQCQVMSGSNAGEKVLVQRNCIEQYEALMSSQPLFEVYKPKKFLGSGRFSTVRLVKHKSTGIKYALKVLILGTTEQQFHRELCIGARLQHKNLMHFIGGISSTDMIITMEYLVGHLLLMHFISKSSVSERTVCNLSLQLLDALEYLHSHTILHLDLRPHNVFIQTTTKKTDTVKLIDFGAARHMTTAATFFSSDHEAAFDYQYVSPESLQHSHYGPGTDMWGFAVILYLIFYGTTPFRSATGRSLQTVANITSVSYFFPDEQSDKQSCSVEAKTLMKAIFVLLESDRPRASATKQFSWFQKSETYATQFINLPQLKSFLTEH